MDMFKQFTTQELIAYLKAFKFARKITQWHIHHTWLPDYDLFKGNNHQALNQGMKDYHVNNNGWSDIAQHFTLFPDGTWLLGRDLNKDPASILGWNTGAICIEMVGNFDKGQDVMTDAQKLAIYEATEFAVEQMGLQAKFHRDSPTAGKTCPGSGIDRATFFNDFTNFTENKLLAEAQSKEEAERQAAIEAARQKAARIKEILSKVRIEFVDMFNKETETVHWANDYVNFCKDRRIIGGIKNDDGTYRFDPDAYMTRAQMATVIAKTVESVEEKIYSRINEVLEQLKGIK